MKLMSLIVALCAVLGVAYMAVAAPNQDSITAIHHSR